MFSQWPFQLRILLAAATGLLVSLGLGAWLVRFLSRRQVVEDISKPDAKRLEVLHADKKNTPTMGGAMILAGLMAGALLWAGLSNIYVVLGLAVAIWLGAAGVVDDALKLRHKRTRRGPRGLNKKTKLLVQAVLGLAVGFFIWRHARDTAFGTRLYVPFLSNSGVDLGWAIIPWFAVVIMATSNSVNITDGLDGLAAGCSLITLLALVPILCAAANADWSAQLRMVHVPGSAELSVFLAALLGSIAGFLWYNGYPADIFMGDTGSLPLGGLIGFMAAAVKQEVLLLLLGAVFVGEMLSVILQVLAFKTTGKRVFSIAPYHHSLQYRGWPEAKITVRLWTVAALGAALGLAVLGLR